MANQNFEKEEMRSEQETQKWDLEHTLWLCY